MSVFLTGSTGYLGAHAAALILENHAERLNLLVRAKTQREAEERLWKSLQLHLDFPRFREHLASRINIFRGDLTDRRFGLDDADYQRLVKSTTSVIHCAASLNRKSEKTCLNVNLRGCLEVVLFAQRAQADHGLRRFSHVSTVAVAGVRSNEVVEEDKSIDWDRSDYDPYARTKKFNEHMLRELLPDVPKTIFRPSIVMGDSRRPETTQFDMVQAFVFLAGLRLLPLRGDDRIDIVPVNFVAESIVTLHQKAKPLHDIYHLSAGAGSQTCKEIAVALSAARRRPVPRFLPRLESPFSKTVRWLSGRRGTAIGHLASLLQVFLPYLTWNTVFANERVTSETGQMPAKFTDYCYPLYKFAKQHNYTYPYRPWPIESSAPLKEGC
jgi:thioester reductase-like protein